jgi:hypothetical protein
VLVGSWLLLVQVGALGARNEAGDTPLYLRYAQRIDAGEVPYRDVRLEYPAGALPVIVVPALGRAGQRTYLRRFHWLTLACLVAVLVAADTTLRASGDSTRARLASLLCIALLPLLLGPVILSRYDLWPAAGAAFALAAFVRGRPALGGVLLGLATAAKFYPLVIAPVAIAFVWQQWGRAAATRAAAALALTVGACLLPFVALSFSGGMYPVTYELHRPLQIESTAAAILIAVHHLFGLRLGDEFSYGSNNLGGTSGAATAVVTTVITLAALAWVWWTCVHQRLSRPRFLTAAAAAVAALLAVGKVFSLQYLIWLYPLIPLVDARVRLRAVTLLCAAYGLTWGWFPARRGIPFLVSMRAPESWFLLARDLVVVSLFLLLATDLRRHADPATRPTTQTDAALVQH